MEFVAILTTSWKLIRAIHDVVERIDQTQEDGRALQYLERQATSFLDTMNQGLVDCEPSPYMSTILSLEEFLRRILETSTALAQMSMPGQFWRASRIKRTILDLRNELQFFVNTYLVQNAKQNAINFEAMASPPPVPGPNDSPLIPDDVQWEIMSQKNVGSATVGSTTRIERWNKDVANLRDLEAGPHDTEPIPLAPMTVREVSLPEPNPKPPSSFKVCWDAWSEALQSIGFTILVCPFRAVICGLDCLGGLCCCQISGCCTDCCIMYFAICTSEECLEPSRCSGMGCCCLGHPCQYAHPHLEIC